MLFTSSTFALAALTLGVQGLPAPSPRSSSDAIVLNCEVASSPLWDSSKITVGAPGNTTYTIGEATNDLGGNFPTLESTPTSTDASVSSWAFLPCASQPATAPSGTIYGKLYNSASDFCYGVTRPPFGEARKQVNLVGKACSSADATNGPRQLLSYDQNSQELNFADAFPLPPSSNETIGTYAWNVEVDSSAPQTFLLVRTNDTELFPPATTTQWTVRRA